MDLSETFKIFYEIKKSDSIFKKKFLLIKICLYYQPHGKSIKDNHQVLQEYYTLYMRYRIVFKKKEEKIFTWLKLLEEHMNAIEEDYHNHTDFLLFLHSLLLIGMLKADKNIIQNVHGRVIDYMDNNILRSGYFKNAYEHDCLGYQINDLRNLFYLIGDLKKYGFYHFNYLERKTVTGGSLLKSFKYLVPFIEKKKTKYEFLNSIFQDDLHHAEFGKPWNVQEGILLFYECKSLHKKIEHLNNLYFLNKANGNSNFFSFHSSK